MMNRFLFWSLLATFVLHFGLGSVMAEDKSELIDNRVDSIKIAVITKHYKGKNIEKIKKWFSISTSLEDSNSGGVKRFLSKSYKYVDVIKTRDELKDGQYDFFLECELLKLSWQDYIQLGKTKATRMSIRPGGDIRVPSIKSKYRIVSLIDNSEVTKTVKYKEVTKVNTKVVFETLNGGALNKFFKVAKVSQLLDSINPSIDKMKGNLVDINKESTTICVVADKRYLDSTWFGIEKPLTLTSLLTPKDKTIGVGGKSLAGINDYLNGLFSSVMVFDSISKAKGAKCDVLFKPTLVNYNLHKANVDRKFDGKVVVKFPKGHTSFTYSFKISHLASDSVLSKSITRHDIGIIKNSSNATKEFFESEEFLSIFQLK